MAWHIGSPPPPMGAPHCAPVAGDPAAADCRFGAASISWGASEQAYHRLRPSDYEATAGRFVRVAEGGKGRWLAVSFCR